MQAIAAALVKAQKEFGPALKTATNPHFRSKYAALDACVEAVIDALNNNGIFLMQYTHPCEDGVIVETMFIHESGEHMSGGRLHVPASKPKPEPKKPAAGTRDKETLTFILESCEDLSSMQAEWTKMTPDERLLVNDVKDKLKGTLK